MYDGNRMVFFDIESREQTIGMSKRNDDEAEYTMKILEKIDDKSLELAIITPYKAQVRLLRTLLPQNVPVNTVDAFQGQEKDIIIFNCVRSNHAGNLGFLED